MPRLRPPVLLWSLGLALAPTRALAEVAVQPFSPLYERQLVGFDDFTFDTDWFPADSPVQLRLIVHGGNSVTISMPGEAGYDWSDETIRFTGAPEFGSFGLDIGFTIDSKVRFDVLGLNWESDILGPYDFAVIAEDMFTPYLLPGNPERPVTIDDQTAPETVVAVPVTPDILVAAGNLNIDAYAIVEASLAGAAIEVEDEAMTQSAVVAEEGASAPLLAGPGPGPLVARGTLVCELMTAPTIVLKPTLVMEILGQEYEIADIEIPVSLPPFDDTIRFAEIALSFPRPPAGDATGGSAGESHGMSGEAPTSGATEGATGGDATGVPGLPDSGGATGGVGPQEDGCACSGGGGATSPFAAAVLLLCRRRRGRAAGPSRG